MALIRQAQAQHALREALVLDLGDLHRQGEAIIAQAKERAGKIVAEAQAERLRLVADAAETGRARGTAEGLSQGRAEGERQGREAALRARAAELASLEAAWGEMLVALEAARERLLEDARRDLLRLAAMIAQRVIKRAVELDPSAVTAQLESVLQMVIRPSRLTVRVHPQDRALVEAALPGLLPRFQCVTHLELADDAGLARGSVAARLGRAGGGSGGSGGGGGFDDGPALGGEIDATVDAQLARLIDVLLPPRDLAGGEGGADGPGGGSGRGPAGGGDVVASGGVTGAGA